MNHHTESPTMNRNRPIPLVAILLAAAALVGACAGSSGPLGSVPVPPVSPDASVAQGSPDVTAAPSDAPSTEPSDTPTGSSTPGASPSTAPTGTALVRSYFWLGGLPGSDG